MNKILIVLFFVAAAVAFEARPSRIFKERVRSQQALTTTPSSEEHEDHESHEMPDMPVKKDEVMGSMDTLSSLAKVQRDQAETFRMWSTQFRTFKSSVMKYMEQSSDLLQKHEKKIQTLQRVASKLHEDINH